MKILHLTLKKKWFDLIKSGEKTAVYIEDKPYWQKRLVNKDGIGKHFDIVRFRNGYQKDSPTIDVEFRRIAFSHREWLKPEHGEILPDKVIVIRLGNIHGDE